MRNNIGVLICNKIYIYAYDIAKNDNEQSKIEIAFIKDNPDGIKFIELFSKANFKETAIKEFVRERITSTQNIESIKNEITPALIADLLKNYFIEKYDIVEFEQAINNFNIVVSYKNVFVDNLATPSDFDIDPNDTENKHRVGRQQDQLIISFVCAIIFLLYFYRRHTLIIQQKRAFL